MIQQPSVETLRAQFEAAGQGHVFAFWERLDAPARAALAAQCAALNLADLARFKEALAGRHAGAAAGGAMEPDAVIGCAQLAALNPRAEGEAALRAGQVGVLLVAGGQGSRLGYEGPKGCYPIAPLSDASLFEIHARKILALERAFGAAIPFYIMTSQANDAATRAFFAEHGFFGLAPERVLFFSQGMWPAMTAEGRLIMAAPDSLFMSPDGHGGILAALKRHGLLEDMRRRGLRAVFYFQVDNPLVEIADPAFVGLHLRRGADMSVKVCLKRDPGEGLGVVVRRAGRAEIIEYSELTEEQKHARQSDGRLRFGYGSVAIHVFSPAFLARQADEPLPLHLAHKKVPFCDDKGRMVKPASPNAYKFEQFIFDVLPRAATSLNVEFLREDEFSPVKNAEGADSPATTRRDMQLKFARWFEVCGVAVPRDGAGVPRYRIEIDPGYAWDAPSLRRRLPSGFTIQGDVWLKP